MFQISSKMFHGLEIDCVPEFSMIQLIHARISHVSGLPTTVTTVLILYADVFHGPDEHGRDRSNDAV
jgi:hypothetical protein